MKNLFIRRIALYELLSTRRLPFWNLLIQSKSVDRLHTLTAMKYCLVRLPQFKRSITCHLQLNPNLPDLCQIEVTERCGKYSTKNSPIFLSAP